MMSHPNRELLGAWALDACDEAEAEAVSAHLGECAECSMHARRLRGAAGWMAVDRLVSPPDRLRETVLDRARRRRPPQFMRTLVEAYASQVSLLARALEHLPQADWDRPDPRHGTVAGIVNHLCGNDAWLARDLGLETVTGSGCGPEAWQTWQSQSRVLLVGIGDEANPRQMVTLAGKEIRPAATLADALVQRAFETWIHTDDLLAVAGQPATTPTPRQVWRIVDLAVRLLPTVLRAHRLAGSGSCHLNLSGDGGGEWTLGLDTTRPLTIRMAAADFARIAANRLPPHAAEFTVEGDRDLAVRVLHAASELGCD